MPTITDILIWIVRIIFIGYAFLFLALWICAIIGGLNDENEQNP